MKRRLDDLAAFGGPSAFRQPVHVGRPHIGDRRALLSRVEDILDRRWLSNHGRYVQEFETRIAEHLGVRHCVATCNGTTALQIAARAADLSGEVIVPSLTFVATAHALAWMGLTPVFCDVDPETHNLDPLEVERLIGARTSAILPVHLWGRPCDVDALSAIAKLYGVRLLFDAAHAFGCSYDGRLVGGFGDLEVFSFHATKVVSTFEGGAVTTDDDELAARARLARDFGFSDYDEVVTLGTNGKMPEVSAAMGLTSLEGLAGFIEGNRRNYDAYRDGLAGVPGLSLVTHDEAEARNYQHVVVDVERDSAGVSRDGLHRVLWAENVLARRYFFPGAHRMEPYRSLSTGLELSLPVTEQLVERILVLPNGGELEPGDVAAICRVVAFVCEHGSEIDERLASPAHA